MTFGGFKTKGYSFSDKFIIKKYKLLLNHHILIRKVCELKMLMTRDGVFYYDQEIELPTKANGGHEMLYNGVIAVCVKDMDAKIYSEEDDRWN